MDKIVEISLPPGEHLNEQLWKERAIKKSGLDFSDIKEIDLIKRSIDSRGKRPVYRMKIRVSTNESGGMPILRHKGKLQKSENGERVIVVGAGPAGYFAALQLLEHGCKPIVVDRGKDVRARRRDLRQIQQFGVVNPDSNYCFGEGGAGTYSDGKLYTRSKKRGNFQKVLEILHEHGAPNDILVEAHPHIGSNKLPRIVQAIRETIEEFGGEVHFGYKVTDFLMDECTVNGVLINGEIELKGRSVILATGHSARDIYLLLHQKGIEIEAKPFALGVRIEHPQSLIDSIQYNMANRGENLPASSYSLACQIGGKGVFSFCMCPGGLIVPASTAPGEIVVNGMSLSRRDSPYANAGTVVSVQPEELVRNVDLVHPLTCMEFQTSVEQMVFKHGDGSQSAPAQRLTDFVSGKSSSSLPSSSYIPGLLSRRVDEILPSAIVNSLQKAVMEFDQKMKGYLTEEAVVVATESRTSSPVRIPRDSQSLMHPQVRGLYPCGEGAGYAGGIMSAAMDGQKVATAVVNAISLSTI
ncbi:MAG: FAD-binding protein [Saprospirales bacterium]|nr:MAG: FAD-binding protein [Saprospirales bacterium]